MGLALCCFMLYTIHEVECCLLLFHVGRDRKMKRPKSEEVNSMNIAYAVKMPLKPLSDGKMGAGKERAARIVAVLKVLRKLGIKE